MAEINFEQREAAHELAIRRAVVVAKASLASKVNRFTSISKETIEVPRRFKELRLFLLKAELAFLDKLIIMEHTNRVEVLFTLFDRDETRAVSIAELAKGLQKLNAQMDFPHVLQLAKSTVAAFGSRDTGYLNCEQFSRFLEQLVKSMDCNFSELCQLIAIRVAFSETGQSVLEDSVSFIVNETQAAGQTIADYNDVIVEARMIILFNMLDVHQEGWVNFKDLVKYLFRFTEDMDATKRQILLMLHTNHPRRLDYCQFASLLLNVVVLLPNNVEFHDLANAITLAACRRDVTEEDLQGLLMRSRDNVNEDGEVEVKAVERELSYGRMNRLFDLWDLDHDGSLDIAELTIGMRKFQEAKHMDCTVNESLEAMSTFDQNSDQRLDRVEFATMLSAFADAADLNLHEVIDFMVVQSALKDCSEEEIAHINSLKHLNSSKGNHRVRRGSLFW